MDYALNFMDYMNRKKNIPFEIQAFTSVENLIAYEMCIRDRRIASTKDGSVTSVQAVYVPADDLTDPAPATTFAHLDACLLYTSRCV